MFDDHKLDRKIILHKTIGQFQQEPFTCTREKQEKIICPDIIYVVTVLRKNILIHKKNINGYNCYLNYWNHLRWTCSSRYIIYIHWFFFIYISVIKKRKEFAPQRANFFILKYTSSDMGDENIFPVARVSISPVPTRPSEGLQPGKYR